VKDSVWRDIDIKIHFECFRQDLRLKFRKN
jgi:hypothetical protein